MEDDTSAARVENVVGGRNDDKNDASKKRPRLLAMKTDEANGKSSSNNKISCSDTTTAGTTMTKAPVDHHQDNKLFLFNSMLPVAVKSIIVSFLNEEGLAALEDSEILVQDCTTKIVHQQWEWLYNRRQDDDDDKKKTDPLKARQQGRIFGRACKMARDMEQTAHQHYIVNKEMSWPNAESLYSVSKLWVHRNQYGMDEFDDDGNDCADKFFVRLCYQKDGTREVLEGYTDYNAFIDPTHQSDYHHARTNRLELDFSSKKMSPIAQGIAKFKSLLTIHEGTEEDRRKRRQQAEDYAQELCQHLSMTVIAVIPPKSAYMMEEEDAFKRTSSGIIRSDDLEEEDIDEPERKKTIMSMGLDDDDDDSDDDAEEEANAANDRNSSHQDNGDDEDDSAPLASSSKHRHQTVDDDDDSDSDSDHDATTKDNNNNSHNNNNNNDDDDDMQEHTNENCSISDDDDDEEAFGGNIRRGTTNQDNSNKSDVEDEVNTKNTNVSYDGTTTEMKLVISTTGFGRRIRWPHPRRGEPSFYLAPRRNPDADVKEDGCVDEDNCYTIDIGPEAAEFDDDGKYHFCIWLEDGYYRDDALLQQPWPERN